MTKASGIPVHCAHDELVDVVNLIPNPRNPNKHGDKQVALLAKIIRHQGWRAPIVVSNRSGFIVTGHGRLEAAKLLGVELVPVNRQDFATEADEWAHVIADNRIAELAETDDALLKELLAELDGKIDMDLSGFDAVELERVMDSIGENPVDAEPQIDRAAELQKEWGTATGQLWELGEHRLLCGDSTKREDVERLMGGERAALVHADPPYGMGKEKDGVQNDNLYADKLDAFQMAWWKAFRPHVEDNGSAYIWGNAEDLWRLWYVGGLKDSERLTLRNEIVWDKGHGQGMESEQHRMFPTATERALFFILGEQGFNNNADNYWDGWEPIRAYLDGERRKSGLTTDQCNQICGKQNMTQPAFTKGGFRLISKEDYEKLRDACNGDAFKRDHDAFKRDHDELKREHDELKRDFYATRAYFDNTHDNMTDVWEFPRVTGEERHGHATPKPVLMICRAIKSSTPEAGIVVEPFLGSGTTLIAAEQLGRKCYGLEISPDYCAVILQRFKDATGKTPTLAPC